MARQMAKPMPITASCCGTGGHDPRLVVFIGGLMRTYDMLERRVKT
jgi:hypothetical protein